MKINRFWALLLSILPFSQCKTIEHTPNSYEGRTLTWGSGGGVTGHVSCVALLDNGSYFGGQGLTEMTFEKKGKLSREVSEQLFKNYDILNLASLQIDRPGNTYKFIELNENGSKHRIVWSSKDDLPNADANTMYNILKSKIEKDQQ
ncbi:MAG: hypothetical protein KTR24_14320 [Saprospiraceae bacterium]|nr:hypothetical protein [Saprospiraceae bacterium]